MKTYWVFALAILMLGSLPSVSQAIEQRTDTMIPGQPVDLSVSDPYQRLDNRGGPPPNAFKGPPSTRDRSYLNAGCSQDPACMRARDRQLRNTTWRQDRGLK